MSQGATSECPVAGFVRVAKSRGGDRMLTVLRPHHERIYRRLVAHAAPLIERSLGPEVAANRVVPGPDLTLRRLSEEWRELVRRRRNLVIGTRIIVQADVRDCYASIGPHSVERALRRLGAMAEAAGAIRGFLERLQEHGVRGLPVGPDASAVLANAVLGAADRSLREAGFRHLRWVDDVWIAADDRGYAQRALSLLHRSLGRSGLHANDRKTVVLGRTDLDHAIELGNASLAQAGESGL